MKKLFLIFFMLLSFFSEAQDISGEWYGWANFDGHPDENNYMISFDLNQKGEQVDGQMTLYYMNEQRKFNIVGLVDPNTQTFLITHIDVPVHFLGLDNFGKVDVDMFLSSKLINYRSGNQLKGHLVSKTYRTIQNINFVLVRPEEEVARVKEKEVELPVVPIQKKMIIKEEIIIYSDSVLITLYDGSMIDGDSVNVYFNNKLILEKVLLTDKPISFSIALKEIGSTALLVFEALNLGSIPPNTGILIIQDGDIRKVLYFASSLEVSCTYLFSKGAR